MLLNLVINGSSYHVNTVAAKTSINDQSLSSYEENGKTYYWRSGISTSAWPTSIIEITPSSFGNAAFTSYAGGGGTQFQNATATIGHLTLNSFTVYSDSSMNRCYFTASHNGHSLGTSSDEYGTAYTVSNIDDPWGFFLFSLIVNGIEGVLICGARPEEGLFVNVDAAAYGGSVWKVGALWVSKNIIEDGIVVPYANSERPGDPDKTGGMGNGVNKGGNVGKTSTSNIVSLGAGFNAYHVFGTDVQALSNYLWGRSGGGFDAGGIWEKFLNYKFNPIAGIISHHIIPASLWSGVTELGRGGISLAGVTMDGVSAPSVLGAPITQHIGHYETGMFSLPKSYNSFADFVNTRVRVFLPFCGCVDLDPSQCIGGGVNVYYQCDVLTGNVVAQVETLDQYGYLHTAAQASGNCAYNVPYTGNDNGTGEIIGALKGVAGGALSGGIGSIINGATTLGFGLERHSTTVAGSLCGSVGWCGNYNIILEIDWGVPLSTAGYYDTLMGRPSYKSGAVSDFTGFSKMIVRAYRVERATEEEKQEIEQICRDGVIV